MDAPEYKRLRRLVLRCFLFSIFLIVIAVFVGSYQLKRLNAQFVASKPTVIKETIVVKDKPIPGESGINGTNGVSIKGAQGNSVTGSKGDAGQNGQNITVDQITGAVAAYLQANPPPAGKQGDTGSPGLVVFIQQNPLTGLLECRRGTDLSWFPISECAS